MDRTEQDRAAAFPVSPNETYVFSSAGWTVHGDNQPGVTHTATYYGTDGRATRQEIISLPYTTDTREGETHVSFGLSVGEVPDAALWPLDGEDLGA